MKKLFSVLGILAVCFFVNATTAEARAKRVAVIVKATDSEFWQSVLLGAENYAKENNGVKVKTYGPPSESNIDQQIAILENVLATYPDAIVIASTSSDASVPAIERAMAEGVPVVTIDNKVNTEEITAHLATDNKKGGALAADMMVAEFNNKGIALKGSVGIVSSMAGVQVNTDRTTGFIDRLSEVAPEIKILPIRYADNDIFKALNIAEDILTANKDVIGFFGDNNMMGNGLSKAIKERELSDSVIAIAYDSDPEEVAALKEGTLKGLVLQDPYGMGYKGVDIALQAVAGKKITEKYIDTGAVGVTGANMNEPEMAALLNPFILEK